MKETIPEEGLEHFDEYLQNYSKNENHPLKILLGFYKGKKLQCAKGFFLADLPAVPCLGHADRDANII